MKTPLKTTKAPLIKTQSDLARKLGISRQSLSKHMRDPEAPALTDVDGWVTFLAAHGRAGSVPKEFRAKLAAARVRLVAAQARRVETANKITEGQLIDVKFVEAGRKIAVTVFWGEIVRMIRDMPVAQTGQIPKILGFDYYQANNIPANAENLVGFASCPGGLFVAFSPIAPNPDVAKLAHYEIVTDPDTGISLEFRRSGNPQKDASLHSVECNYGYLLGNAAAIKRIVSQ